MTKRASFSKLNTSDLQEYESRNNLEDNLEKREKAKQKKMRKAVQSNEKEKQYEILNERMEKFINTRTLLTSHSLASTSSNKQFEGVAESETSEKLISELTGENERLQKWNKELEEKLYVYKAKYAKQVQRIEE